MGALETAVWWNGAVSYSHVILQNLKENSATLHQFIVMWEMTITWGAVCL